MRTQAKLIQVTGDQEDFTDVIGHNGELYVSKSPWFKANGDVISMLSRRITREDGLIKISTKLGNTFTFRVL